MDDVENPSGSPLPPFFAQVAAAEAEKPQRKKRGPRKVGKSPALAAPYGKQKRQKRAKDPYAGLAKVPTRKRAAAPLKLDATILPFLVGLKPGDVEVLLQVMNSLQMVNKVSRGKILQALGKVMA
jgi:hypothetical protein